MSARAWAAASIVVYAAVTAVLGRAVLGDAGATIANDTGDPLLTAAILHWNAHHLPLSDAWWQLPIFHPTQDTLAFSEHLLGVSLIASPLAWLTGNALAAYNVTMLLMFPLAAIAMRVRDLHVVVPQDAANLRAFVARQPGAVLTAENAAVTQYRLPRQAGAAMLPRGASVSIASVGSPCMIRELPLLRDDDDRNLWACPPGGAPQEVTIDLGAPQTIGAVIYGLGRYYWVFASQMAIETSIDGASWSEARRGSVLGELIAAGLEQPRSLRVMLPFAPREARYVRVRPINQKKDFHWSIAELEVWGGDAKVTRSK